MLSNEWKPFSLWFSQRGSLSLLAICCSTQSCSPLFLAVLHPCFVLLPLSSAFYSSTFMKPRYGHTLLQWAEREREGEREKFYSNKTTLILQLAHSGWQSAICSRCTKRSGLSMYFCMRDWVRTLQFNSRFNRNTTEINHPRYLRDGEACASMLYVVLQSVHHSLWSQLSAGLAGWLEIVS